MTDKLADRVRDVLAVDADEYEAQAEADAEVVKSELAAGTFDNHQSIVGLEYEFYAVADGRWSSSDDNMENGLMRVPRRLLELIGFEKELGLHNAEMTTSPQPLNPHGLRAQESEVLARLTAALQCTSSEGMRLVSDGLWTIPPTGETAREYLTDSISDGGIRVATNMSDSVRYHAMANGETATGQMSLDAPHVELDADTVMPESLITSIQPHYQVAHAADLPTYFNYALRVAGPLLALGVNSPLFPPDLYDDADPTTILDDAYMENRITVFESVLNGEDAEKVRFPDDLSDVEEAVDRVASDESIVPMPVPRGDRFDDSFATLRRKHGTFWRWVRPVFDGETRSSANARIEFRPIAAQPTVRDSIAFQAAFAGLMESLPKRRHPVIDQDWQTAKENFYAAMRNGFGSRQRWIANDGHETTNAAEVYDDILAHAVDGLKSAGCSEAEANRYVAPLRVRAESGRTPAGWKINRVHDALADGLDFDAAIFEMQREYIDRQSETLLEGSFSDWL
ncbi:hypothetical protein GL213_08310 [Halogeometricum borinquense]|uniref:Glutamate--cysteine ligase n=1 Tax=Halogeometricum borinquense TaxID=60847 RepID=A0A6C0UIW9_9EURY|nr:hypothetical protein [Halogeometricum borinquense]QIB74533.1 hypothetical protein G3I44_09720 [Halogeometricum borinquense]QIQ76523.1 hypothetical protein GL213_08310 [Halogeometricum borinquense]